MIRHAVRSFVMLMVPVALAAQAAPAPSANPMTDAFKRMTAGLSRNLVAAAEEMPAEKYSYKPTPAQMTFGEVALHLAGANYSLCAVFGTAPKPTAAMPDSTATKEARVAALKGSFEYCNAALASLTDAKLGEARPSPFGQGTMTRAAAALIYAMDLEDHYSQWSNYLRLNGLLPPSARGRGEG